MTYKLTFLIQNKLFMIVIDGNNIFYNDKISGVQQLYPTPSARALKAFGPPTKEEKEEYDMCKTEEELKSFVLKDTRKMGARLVKEDKG
jgi:hypothetical protein